MGRAPPPGGGADQGAPRQGRQPGDGAGRRRAARLGPRRRTPPRPRSTPATSACSTRCLDAVGRGRCASASPATTCSTWPGRLRDELAGGRRAAVGIEMLEGMAPAQARAVRADAGGVLLYTPGGHRRGLRGQHRLPRAALDENTGPENFLRALFTITPGSPAFVGPSAAASRQAVADRASSRAVRRAAGRRTAGRDRRFDPDAPFANEPDTDFTAGRPTGRDRRARRRADRPARPARRHVDAAIDAVVAGPSTARRRGGDVDRRAAACSARSPRSMAAAAGATLAVMAHEAGKTVREGDPEVSEAIDFARWAAASCASTLDELAAGVDGRAARRRRRRRAVELPVRDPGRRRVAALAAGNAVLLKPAPEAVATAAGLLATSPLRPASPRTSCSSCAAPTTRSAARWSPTRRRRRRAHRLLRDGAAVPRLAARRCACSPRRAARTPSSISQTADVDLALRDLVRSAFGHAGQKCSAASLAIVEARCTTTPSSCAPAGRRRAQPAGRAGDRPGHDGRPADRARRRGRCGAASTTRPGESWLVGAAARRRAAGWTPGRPLGVRAGLVVPPDRVLRARCSA